MRFISREAVCVYKVERVSQKMESYIYSFYNEITAAVIYQKVLDKSELRQTNENKNDKDKRTEKHVFRNGVPRQ